MLKERISILVLHFVYFSLNLFNFCFRLIDFLLILNLISVVLLNNLELLKPLGQDLVSIQVVIDFLSHGRIVFIELIELAHDLFIHILLNSWQEALLGGLSRHIKFRLSEYLFLLFLVHRMKKRRIFLECLVLSCEENGIQT